MVLVFLLMILLHIIDDFVLQSASLAKLKQKSFWQNDPVGKEPMYRNDYKAALIIHGLLWSIMVHLPLIFLQFWYEYPYMEWYLFVSVLAHAEIHALIDDEKANFHKINLVQDQLYHFLQICSAFFLWLFTAHIAVIQ